MLTPTLRRTPSIGLQETYASRFPLDETSRDPVSFPAWT